MALPTKRPRNQGIVRSPRVGVYVFRVPSSGPGDPTWHSCAQSSRSRHHAHRSNPSPGRASFSFKRAALAAPPTSPLTTSPQLSSSSSPRAATCLACLCNRFVEHSRVSCRAAHGEVDGERRRQWRQRRRAGGDGAEPHQGAGAAAGGAPRRLARPLQAPHHADLHPYRALHQHHHLLQPRPQAQRGRSRPRHAALGGHAHQRRHRRAVQEHQEEEGDGEEEAPGAGELGRRRRRREPGRRRPQLEEVRPEGDSWSQEPKRLLPLHAPALPGMPGDKAGAAHRRGPDALRRHLPRRPHLRPEAAAGGGRPAGAQSGREHLPAEPDGRPHGEDRGAAGLGRGGAGLGRRGAVLLLLHDAGERVPGCGRAQPVLRAFDVGELGRVAGDLGLQPRRLLPAVRGRRVAGAERAPRGGVRARGRQRAAGARRGRTRRAPRHGLRELLRVIHRLSDEH